MPCRLAQAPASLRSRFNRDLLLLLVTVTAFKLDLPTGKPAGPHPDSEMRLAGSSDISRRIT
jgi:hypothetical protein